MYHVGTTEVLRRYYWEGLMKMRLNERIATDSDTEESEPVDGCTVPQDGSVNDNYSSASATIKTHCYAGLVFYVVSVSSTVPNPWASPFGGAESFAPPRAQKVSEPKGLAGAPGQPPPFSFWRGTRILSPSNSKMMA
jgi:hypothetical protein